MTTTNRAEKIRELEQEIKRLSRPITQVRKGSTTPGEERNPVILAMANEERDWFLSLAKEELETLSPGRYPEYAKFSKTGRSSITNSPPRKREEKMATNKAPVKKALRRAEKSTKQATKAVQRAEKIVAKTPVKVAAATKSAAKAIGKASTSKGADSAIARGAQTVARAVTGAPAKKVAAGNAFKVAAKPASKTAPVARAAKQVTRLSPKPAAKAAVKSTGKPSKPTLSVVRRSGPQLKSRVIVENKPAVPATSEKTREQTVIPPAAVVDRKAVMRELAGSTSATAHTSSQAPASWARPQELLAQAREELRSDTPATHPSSPLAGSNETVQAQPATSEKAQVQFVAPAAVDKPAPTLPHGIGNLAASSIVPVEQQDQQAANPGPFAAARRLEAGRPADGQPATSENTGAQTRPQWKSALAGGAPWPRSGLASGGAARPSTPTMPSTGAAPGLIERRFEIYPEGPGAYRWRLVEAATGKVVSTSKTPFGTPSAAEDAAGDEARLYRPGSTTVIRLNTNPSHGVSAWRT